MAAFLQNALLNAGASADERSGTNDTERISEESSTFIR
jgi:hypothetical protein